MYRFIIMSILFSTFCLYSMQNDTYFVDSWWATMAKLQDDNLVAKLCDAAYKECPAIRGNEDDYKCQIGYDAENQQVIDIEIVREEMDDIKRICAYQYDWSSKKLKKIDLN